MIIANVVVPQALWWRRVRTNITALFIISLVVNVGMWLERFVIVVTSLHRTNLPASWGMYYPTFWDWATFFGTIGLFFALLFLFIRLLPMISIFEMRELVAEVNEREQNAAAPTPPAPLLEPGD
jgi:molybdopterin-containing oxidoreductase family membrane subunit